MAAAAEEKSQAAGAPAPGGGAGGNKLVPILAIVNVVATLAMAGILFISFQHEKKSSSVEDIQPTPAGGDEAKKEEGHGEGHGEGHEGAKKKSAEFGRMVTLDQFTVNLDTPGTVNPRFVQINMSLEVPNEEVENEVNSKMPQVRNVVIDLFNSKRPNDLANSEGRDYVKDEIRSAINGFLVTGKVKGVYFTNFHVGS